MSNKENAIFVRIATVYGVTTLYPVCDKAKAFCNIAGTKTITPAMTREINAIGFKVFEDPTAFAQRKIKMGVDA
jgi:hypothetical protein